ncbi:MAG: hypothetical protein MI810_22120 [Flavobacteriales bacterium]|jgi:hypothetical protein|nr:hypothetical protein [Flavobacteriales bacterium]
MKYFLIIGALLLSLTAFDQLQSEELGKWKIKHGAFDQAPQNSLDTLAEQYWDVFYTIFPHEKIDKYIVSLRLITDGVNGDLGGLNQLDASLKRWELDIDTADMNLNSRDSLHINEYLFTLVHEFGHLISLNIEQMKPTNDRYQNDKKGYLTSEGYARKGGYLDAFVKEFWTGKLMEDWTRVDELYNTNEWVDSIYQFYLNYPDNFVTDYAAENPEEDLAESWSFFIFKFKGRVSTETIKDRKMSFFYQYPELVAYRKHIRTNIHIYTHKLFDE